MEFGTPFSFPFKDPDWFKKLIIMGVVTLIPIVGQIVLLGWSLQIARRVINNDPNPLPSLDFGAQLGLGFKTWVVSLVYAIPLIILTLPIYVIPPIGVAVGMDADTLNYLTIGISCLCGGIAFIYAIIMALMMMAAQGRLAATDALGSAFKIGEIFGMVKAAPVAYLLAIVGFIIAGIVSSLGSIACGIGVLLTVPFGQAIIGHFLGQAYKQAAEKANLPA
jgi:hypothetical protein